MTVLVELAENCRLAHCNLAICVCLVVIGDLTYWIISIWLSTKKGKQTKKSALHQSDWFTATLWSTTNSWHRCMPWDISVVWLIYHSNMGAVVVGSGYGGPNLNKYLRYDSCWAFSPGPKLLVCFITSAILFQLPDWYTPYYCNHELFK